jgi:Tfp pilus assembly protein PilN
MKDEIKDFSVGNVRLVHWVAGLIFVVVLALTGWAQFQKSQLNADLTDVEAETNQVETLLDQMRADKLDAVIIAQQLADQVESEAVQWSGVVTRLLNITPLDVFYNSYSASVDSQMNVNAITDSYESAAQLISVLDKESTFTDVFVPSLTQGDSDTGSEVVSFGVSFNVK